MREIKFKAWDGEKIRRVYAISNGHANAFIRYSTKLTYRNDGSSSGTRTNLTLSSTANFYINRIRELEYQLASNE